MGFTGMSSEFANEMPGHLDSFASPQVTRLK